MNVSKLVIIVFALVLVLGGCKKNNQFTISGKITHAGGKTLYLEELLVSTTRLQDSVKINNNGEFKFKSESSIPTYYLLKFTEDKMITLLIDSLENVTVEADYANFSREYNVEGSPGSILVKQLNDKLNDTREKLDSLRSLENMYRGNPDYEKLKKEWDNEYNKIIQDQVDYSTNF
ncbi:MAG TPA: DUF4369 domain-containing protein, partial [Draconibacterium sp.]|nr:DUF4369 domain-containing protein [Draconibacterium sp.]